MILVFGGTTEGRKAVEVLEEAGATYYYSTYSEGQKIDLVHGIHLTGGMEVPEMVTCCREHNIRLIVDAAHPFAEELHRNLLFLAKHIQAPIIRYDRIYPPHTDDVIWCKDYQDAMKKLESDNIDRLLALTGVNNISTLRPYWEKHECWFRILNRRFSQMLAHKSRFPEDHLVYYEEDETLGLIERLKPQAILTKESGLSGGFTEKVEIAKQTGVKVYVIERPEYPPHTPNPQNVHLEYVNGPYGLRRAVEKLLPEFYALHSGLTTGTCATAAAIAATLQYLKKEAQHSSFFILHSSLPKEVPVILPNGETISVPVGYAEGYAYCIKEAGDDPDVTNGIEIRAKAHPLPLPKGAEPIAIECGEGVGRFTLPGFDFPPGEPAINKVPREMIRQNLKELYEQSNLPSLGEGLGVGLSVPQGEEIARRTFNPRLGVEGGISIIGVSGIVKPFSEEAFIDSIRKCMTVAQASGSERVVINSGGKSERFVKALYPSLPQQAFVEYGNYIGETLKIAHELDIKAVTLGVMLGKAVKLAAGHLDTHSRKATMDKDFIRQQLPDE
ncbi:MAG: cobalamin biosynthesis protein CbiD, partial [Prevotella sp.]|nr:cobalamin biosynthesis protein CbiD [Prevotella sp.]